MYSNISMDALYVMKVIYNSTRSPYSKHQGNMQKFQLGYTAEGEQLVSHHQEMRVLYNRHAY